MGGQHVGTGSYGEDTVAISVRSPPSSFTTFAASLATWMSGKAPLLADMLVEELFDHHCVTLT